MNITLLLKLFSKSLLTIYGITLPSLEPGIIFLNYHRVVGNLPLELDISYDIFCKQIKYLISNKKIISYDTAIKLLQSKEALGSNLYVLTFDDGYLDFYTHVFPLLKKYDINAILFTSTAFIDEGYPLPLSKLLYNSENIKSISWEMLREMHNSGLVTIGCHTHNHFELPAIQDAQIEDELSKSLDMLKKEVGIDACHFAYPRAKWDARSEDIVKRFFETAVISDGCIAKSTNFNKFRISRMPIQKSDRWFFFICKVNGYLRNEQNIYNKFRFDSFSRKQIPCNK